MTNVVFTTNGNFNFNENEPINLNLGYTFTLTPEEILEEPNKIVQGNIYCNPTTDKLLYSFNINNSNFNINGIINLDDFQSQIYYVDKGKSDKNQTPVIKSKYSEIPPNKDIFRINPIETSKSFDILLELIDSKNNVYSKNYNINISIRNNSISDWINNYLEENV